MTITEFLLARIAEDEAAARKVHEMRCDTPADTTLDSMNRPMSPCCGCDWHISRALAECEAKRRVVRFHGSEILGICQEDGLPFPCRTLEALLPIYASHPDYDES